MPRARRPAKQRRQTTHHTSTDHDALATAFVHRYTRLLERLGEVAPAQSLLDALAAPDDVGGLAELLAEVSPLDPPRPDPLAAARARGVRAKEEVLNKAGGGHRVGEVAELLGVTPQAVHARRQRGTLLAVPRMNGEFLYPACQFTPDGVLPELDRFLKAFAVPEPWTQLAVLISASPELEGRSPLEALRAGECEAAAGVARAYGEHLG